MRAFLTVALLVATSCGDDLSAPPLCDDGEAIDKPIPDGDYRASYVCLSGPCEEMAGPIILTIKRQKNFIDGPDCIQSPIGVDPFLRVCATTTGFVGTMRSGKVRAAVCGWPMGGHSTRQSF